MKISLYHLLMTYGEVIEISIRQVANLRGQGFATFRDQDMADRALKELQGFVLFGNKMVINHVFISFLQDLQYARQVSDITLKQKGAYDDSIRLNRKQKRKAKAGNTPYYVLLTFLIEKKRLEKREKLQIKEQQFKSQISSKVQALHDSSSLVIEGLPKNYNQLMLQELVRPFHGLQDYKLLDNERALVHFSKHEDAKVALAGNIFD